MAALGKKLVYVVTEDWYFLSHRLPMVRAAQQAGFDVAVATNITSDQNRAAIEQAGVRVIPFSLDRRSLDPLRALGHIAALKKIYAAEKPDVVHHIAMKPVLYGSLAAALTGVPSVVNAFAGLGYVFYGQTILARGLCAALMPVFRVLLKRKGSFLLLQNEDDLKVLAKIGLVPAGRTIVIRGSGVDTKALTPQPLPPGDDFICVYAGRMISMKGLDTLKAAFAALEKTHPHIKLWLCGRPDPANPGSWTEEQLAAWAARSGNVVYKGHCPDMPAVWARAHLALQPSWGGEGVPKSLLEAAACGRAAVASDVAGCRDVVVDGQSGILAPPRDAGALAQAIIRMAQDRDFCAKAGRAARARVEREFSAESVTRHAVALYQGLTAP